MRHKYMHHILLLTNYAIYFLRPNLQTDRGVRNPLKITVFGFQKNRIEPNRR